MITYFLVGPSQDGCSVLRSSVGKIIWGLISFQLIDTFFFFFSPMNLHNRMYVEYHCWIPVYRSIFHSNGDLLNKEYGLYIMAGLDSLQP